MSIGKTLGRVGIVLSVAVMVALVGCTDEGNSTGGGGGGGGGNYNNGEVRIGDQTWTTKNININTANSWCYKDSSSYCAKYGRLYTWDAAKSACTSMGGGWRLPDVADWDKLVNYAGGSSVAGKKLKSKTGWSSNTGTDDYGFSALPGGYRGGGGNFNGAGDVGAWWSAREAANGAVYYRDIDDYDDKVDELLAGSGKSNGFSVRCVTD